MKDAGDRIQELTPSQIVSELDKYIIGQDRAKKAVAIALRNRWRRQRVEGALKDEIYPANIIMIGPTGVGKTEIARRLAKLAGAPFLKVEASKFTEVGYVGRDVESMVRDLMEFTINMVKHEENKKVQEKARENVEERLLNLLFPVKPLPRLRSKGEPSPEDRALIEKRNRTREKLRTKLNNDAFEDRMIEIETKNHLFPVVEIFPGGGIEDLDVNFQELLSGLIPKKSKKRKLTVAEARPILENEETQKLVNLDEIINTSLKKVQNSGIIFIDEIDKVAGDHAKTGPDVSREGVQRDLLPIVEGSSVPTRYGIIKSDHILFIAAGAFHSSSPSDLIPEIQGRFPLRVELDNLTKKDFIRILREPENALIKQYTALLKTEDVSLVFQESAIDEIAELAVEVNRKTENIGARRLHTILSTLLEDILFDTPESKKRRILVTKKMVRAKLKDIVEDEDLSKYIL